MRTAIVVALYCIYTVSIYTVSIHLAEVNCGLPAEQGQQGRSETQAKPVAALAALQRAQLPSELLDKMIGRGPAGGFVVGDIRVVEFRQGDEVNKRVCELLGIDYPIVMGGMVWCR